MLYYDLLTCTVSVEDILSFEVHSKFHVSKGRGVTSSGRVIQELGKTFPEAASVFNRCFEGSPSATAGTGGSREDYAQLQSGSPAERKVLWIRVALVDGKLQAIVEQLMKKPRYMFSYSINSGGCPLYQRSEIELIFT